MINVFTSLRALLSRSYSSYFFNEYRKDSFVRKYYFISSFFNITAKQGGKASKVQWVTECNRNLANVVEGR